MNKRATPSPDDVLRRMLGTPPEPFTPKVAKAKKPKRKKK